MARGARNAAYIHYIVLSKHSATQYKTVQALWDERCQVTQTTKNTILNGTDQHIDGSTELVVLDSWQYTEELKQEICSCGSSHAIGIEERVDL